MPKLPPLCRRADLLELGLTDDVIIALRFEIESEDAAVPPRRIGCLRLPSSRATKRPPARFYRSADALKLIGKVG